MNGDIPWRPVKLLWLRGIRIHKSESRYASRFVDSRKRKAAIRCWVANGCDARIPSLCSQVVLCEHPLPGGNEIWLLAPALHTTYYKNIYFCDCPWNLVFKYITITVLNCAIFLFLWYINSTNDTKFTGCPRMNSWN